MTAPAGAVFFRLRRRNPRHAVLQFRGFFHRRRSEP